MEVLHVMHAYFPAMGGTERVVQKVAEQMVAGCGDGVTIYTTTAYNCELFWRNDQKRMQAGWETINGVRVRRFPVYNGMARLRWLVGNGSYVLHLPYSDWARALYNGPIVPGLEKAITQAPADVIVASPFPLLHMHTAQRAARRSCRPFVYLWGAIHAADDWGFNRRNIYQAVSSADRYIAITEFEREYLIERGLDGKKIAVASPGIDAGPFMQADGSVLRRQLGWGDAPVIAFVGQQVPHKGVDMLTGVMPAVWERHPDACLLIAGARSTYSSTIEGWVAGLPEARRSRVALIHDFAEDEKPGIFAACDMLASPSGYESFGVVFLEAWAAAKPVIGVRLGAIPYVVDEGRDGLLIRHRNAPDLVAAILTLLENPQLGRDLGAAGQQKVLQHHRWPAVADKIRDVYQEVCNRA